jgi:hypothetical protein
MGFPSVSYLDKLKVMLRVTPKVTATNSKLPEKIFANTYFTNIYSTQPIPK